MFSQIQCCKQMWQANRQFVWPEKNTLNTPEMNAHTIASYIQRNVVKFIGFSQDGLCMASVARHTHASVSVCGKALLQHYGPTLALRQIWMSSKHCYLALFPQSCVCPCDFGISKLICFIDCLISFHFPSEHTCALLPCLCDYCMYTYTYVLCISYVSICCLNICTRVAQYPKCL